MDIGGWLWGVGLERMRRYSGQLCEIGFPFIGERRAWTFSRWVSRRGGLLRGGRCNHKMTAYRRQ